MFANSGKIAAGNLSILGLNIVGTRILSKTPSFYNIGQIAYYSQYLKDLRTMHGGSFLQAFGISTLSYLKNPAGPFKWLGYGLAAWQVTRLGISICTRPDFENSPWILY